MEGKFKTYVIFFALGVGAVVTGTWLYSMVNKAKIMPPPVAPV